MPETQRRNNAAAPQPTKAFKVLTVILLLCAFFGSLSLYPTVPLILLARFAGPRTQVGTLFLHIANAAANNISGGFFIVTGVLLRKLVGIQAEVSAVVPGKLGSARPTGFSVNDVIPLPPTGKVSIIISNHRTRLDWMLLWIVLAWTTSIPYALKIVLKDELARMPFFGWAMQYFRFIFLSRSWQSDQARLEAAATYYRQYGDTTVLLIFPEGTDLHPGAIAKSDEFAAKNNVAKYKHVLHPRTTGFTSLVEALGSSLHEVIDVTIGYEDFVVGERPSEKSFFAGRCTRKINVLVERWRVNNGQPAKPDEPSFTLPSTKDPEALAAWLTNQFKKKEDRLTDYYALPRKQEAPLAFSWMNVGYKLKLAPEANVFPTQEEAWVRMRPALPSFMNERLIPCMWAAGVVALVVGSVSSLPSALFVLSGVCFYVVETKRTGGVDQWLLFSAPVVPRVRNEKS